MNNFLKIKILLIFILTSCITSKQELNIIQKNSILPVYAILSSDTKRIVRLCFPKEILIINNSLIKKSFIKIAYDYNSIQTPIDDYIILYDNVKGVLKRVSNTEKKIINSKENKKYFFYTVHYIDKVNFLNQELKNYRNKMLAKNQDTLHIGTVAEFKQKHKELFERLTKNDSISIQLLDNDKLGERITVPVKW